MDKLKSVYQVSVVEQRLAMQQIPRLASGAVGTVGFAFTGLDSGNWAGRTCTAVFWRNEKKVHHVLTREGLGGQSGELKIWVAVAPAEVMAEEGAFWLGLMGTAEDGTVLPTEAIRLNVFQGAITTPTADPAEPTPDIYAQLLQGYAFTKARLSEVIAMRGGSGETVIEMSGDDYVQNGTIRLNGASAVVTFEIDELALDAYGEHSTDECIQPAQAPLFPEGLDSIPIYCDSASFDVSIKKGAEGWSYIKIINKDSDIAHAYGTKCWGFFPLASVTVPELVDARVDSTGKAWPTLGDHLRELFAQLSRTGGAGRIAHIDLQAKDWKTEAESLYSQVVSIEGATQYSKIDLNPSVEQLAIFHVKDISLVAENEDGVVTVYCVGQKPTADYQMQITITEVLLNG